MADLNLSLPTGELSLSAGVAKTCWTGKAPANQRLKIAGFEIMFKSTNPTDTPVKIELSIITTNGGTASTLTPQPNDNDLGETPQGTYKYNYTVEPSAYGANLRTWEIQPQTGILYYFPVGWEIKIKGGAEIGLRLTATQAETVSITPILEE